MLVRIPHIAAEGVLTLAVLAAASCTPAMAMQSSFDMSPAPLFQEPQHPQAKPDMQMPNAAQPAQQELKAVVLTGTIVKSGSDFVFKESSGTIYKLDAPDKAQPFEGKSVKVTGKLETSSNLIHVEAIEDLSA